ncbi:MAG: hypothetical protein N2559_00120 [Anaerolineae bacterium]|nr:hypothetical protein [Anaerolineae bacterium]
MRTRTALIIIGRYTDDWQTLTTEQKHSFIERVGRTLSVCNLTPLLGYRLTSTPGAFIEVWEADDARAIDRAIKNLQAWGYARYVDARWMIGERAVEQ